MTHAPSKEKLLTLLESLRIAFLSGPLSRPSAIGMLGKVANVEGDTTFLEPTDPELIDAQLTTGEDGYVTKIEVQLSEDLSIVLEEFEARFGEYHLSATEQSADNLQADFISSDVEHPFNCVLSAMLDPIAPDPVSGQILEVSLRRGTVDD